VHFFLCWQVVRGFFVAVLATDIEQNFKKTHSESSFPGGSGHIFNFFLGPSRVEKTRLENDDIDPRGFYRGKTSWICVVTFWTSFLGSGWSLKIFF
jgi:hypothetical protein